MMMTGNKYDCMHVVFPLSLTLWCSATCQNKFIVHTHAYCVASSPLTCAKILLKYRKFANMNEMCLPKKYFHHRIHITG